LDLLRGGFFFKRGGDFTEFLRTKVQYNRASVTEGGDAERMRGEKDAEGAGKGNSHLINIRVLGTFVGNNRSLNKNKKGGTIMSHCQEK